MELIGKKVLVRAHSAGVYYGTLKAVQRTGQIADSQFMLKRWSYWMLVKLYLAQMRQSKTLNR